MRRPDPAHLAAELDRVAKLLAETLHAVATLRAQLETAQPLCPPPLPQEFLDTVTLAARFGLTRGQVARLCASGEQAGIVGIEKDGVHGPGWRATVQAFRHARSLKS